MQMRCRAFFPGGRFRCVYTTTLLWYADHFGSCGSAHAHASRRFSGLERMGKKRASQMVLHKHQLLSTQKWAEP